MYKTYDSASLSSTSVCSQNSAATVTARLAPDFGWRSEAFAEDLQADAAFNQRADPPRPVTLRWHGLLLCALPLALAAVGGILAYLNISA